jgi:hypothetical protein
MDENGVEYVIDTSHKKRFVSRATIIQIDTDNNTDDQTPDVMCRDDTAIDSEEVDSRRRACFVKYCCNTVVHCTVRITIAECRTVIRSRAAQNTYK